MRVEIHNHTIGHFSRHHPVNPAPPPEDLLVFYLPELLDAGFTEVPSFNPYWRYHGRTFAPHRAATGRLGIMVF